jgi:hypothetical protein
LSCHFGPATAGEHADFKVQTELAIVAGGNSYDLDAERNIQKVEGAVKDADNFIVIEPLRVYWPEGESFKGVAAVTGSTSLVGPSGKVQGDAVVSSGRVLVNIPGSPEVMHDGNDWDYDPNTKSIVVPLIANPDIVDKGYEVTVVVNVWNNDEKLTFAGSGSGSTDIVKVDEQDFDYILIEPVFAKLTSVEWNGDDDGSGIVSGSIVVKDPSGKEISNTTFENHIVGFASPVKFADEGWDYDPEPNEIVVPLLAVPELVDWKYTVTVDFIMTMADIEYHYGSDAPILIERKDGTDGDYVPIKPVHAILLEGKGWNGEDDGSGEITGTITVYDPAGDIYDTFSVENLKISFISEPLPES